MPVPEQINITHYRGDSLTMQLTLWTDAGKTVPADLSAATVRGQVRQNHEDVEAAADFDIEIAANVVTVTLSPKEARDLPPQGFWDVEVDWFSDDTSVQTVIGGGWITQPDVTRNGVVA